MAIMLSACNNNEESIEVQFYAIHHTVLIDYIVEQEFDQSVYDKEPYGLRFNMTDEAIIIDTYADYVESTPGAALDHRRDDFYDSDFFIENQIIVIRYFSKQSPAFKLTSYSINDQTIDLTIETTPRIVREIYNEWETMYTLVIEVMSKEVQAFNYNIVENQTPLRHFVSNVSQDVLASPGSKTIFTDFEAYENEINNMYQISEESFIYGFELPTEETFDDWHVFVFVLDKSHSNVLELEDVYVRYDFGQKKFTVEYILKPMTGASTGVSQKTMSIVLFPKNMYVDGMDLQVIVYDRNINIQ
jgi:hypothetical protein